MKINEEKLYKFLQSLVELIGRLEYENRPYSAEATTNWPMNELDSAFEEDKNES